MPMQMQIPQSTERDSFDHNPLSGKRLEPAPRPLRHARPLCGDCLRRPALARVRRGWVVLKDHDVCRQCWRGRMDSRRARRFAA
jgi:hypothetical protein